MKRRKRSEKMENSPLKKPQHAMSMFMSEKRESVAKNNPKMPYCDVTKALETMWSAMSAKDRRPYLMKAEKDKEEYMKKMVEYQGDSQSNGILDDDEPSKKEQKLSKAVLSDDFNIPIFTEEFLDYNKSKESELRSLRKSCAEYKEQNVILSQHNDNLKSAINKLDAETKEQREKNEKSKQNLKKLRENLVRSFINVQLPETGMRPTLENIDKYMKNVYYFLETSPNKYPTFSHEVRAVMRMVDIAEI